MSPKLKLALIRRCSDRGFALPIAISLGFIILLVVATLLMRSQGDQMNALAQKSTSQGLSAAETGVTRYQSLIDNNRVIAAYKDCEGTRDATGACPDTVTTKSWANASTIPGISSCSGGSGATTVVNKSSIAWTDVDASDPSKGQYRLISYVYPAPGSTGTVGTVPGTGQLTVEGRVNQVGSTATQSVGTAITRLQVNIPVNEGDLSNTPIPGLWLKTGTMPGNQTTKGNILLNDCSISPAPTPTTNQELDASGNPYTDPNTGQRYQTKQVSITFPNLPARPSPFITGQDLRGISSDMALPRNGDRSTTGAVYPATGGIFEYSVDSVSGNHTITISNTPGVKVRFYLGGDIAKQTEFHHDCSTSGCDPTDFQIFGYGDLAGSQKKICINGNNLIDAFIFAPSYSAGVAGNGQFRGSVWVNDFNAPACSSSSNHMVVLQLATWNSLGLVPQGLPPNIAPINTWQRQETP